MRSKTLSKILAECPKGIEEKVKSYGADKVKEYNERPCLICDVPLDVHGTCCGWPNAATKINEFGVIIDNRHPNFGKLLSNNY